MARPELPTATHAWRICNSQPVGQIRRRRRQKQTGRRLRRAVNRDRRPDGVPRLTAVAKRRPADDRQLSLCSRTGGVGGGFGSDRSLPDDCRAARRRQPRGRPAGHDRRRVGRRSKCFRGNTQSAQPDPNDPNNPAELLFAKRELRGIERLWTVTTGAARAARKLRTAIFPPAKTSAPRGRRCSST